MNKMDAFVYNCLSIMLNVKLFSVNLNITKYILLWNLWFFIFIKRNVSANVNQLVTAVFSVLQLQYVA